MNAYVMLCRRRIRDHALLWRATGQWRHVEMATWWRKEEIDWSCRIETPVYCAWCGRHERGPVSGYHHPAVSHGMCPACAERERGKIRAKQEAIAC